MNLRLLSSRVYSVLFTVGMSEYIFIFLRLDYRDHILEIYPVRQCYYKKITKEILTCLIISIILKVVLKMAEIISDYWTHIESTSDLIESDNTAEMHIVWAITKNLEDTSSAVPAGLLRYKFWVY